MAKVAVIADQNVTTYFKAAGVKHAYAVKDAREASKVLYSLAEEKQVAIIVVTENVASWIGSDIEEVSRRVYPTVVTIPGLEGPAAEKVSPLMRLVKRTIGVEVKI